MDRLKICAWNIEHADKLWKAASTPPVDRKIEARLDAVAEEIAHIDADVLFISEGPGSEAAAEGFFGRVAPAYRLVTRNSTDWRDYRIKGTQWLWFLVRNTQTLTGELQHIDRWRTLTESASEGDHRGGEWEVSYPVATADFQSLSFKVPGRHSHYRHPQVLLLNVDGTHLELIGCHLKSKINKVRVPGDPYAPDYFDRNPALVADVIQSRIKLTTECTDIRHYIHARFTEDPGAPIIVLGDLNDGPGKERIEKRFLYHDLVSSLQGDVFLARQFLNHALFDFPQEARWSYHLQGGDKLDPRLDPRILLDHIMFTQSLSGGGDTGAGSAWRARAGGGQVEHDVHHRVASGRPKYAETSDHRPVSMVFDRRR